MNELLSLFSPNYKILYLLDEYSNLELLIQLAPYQVVVYTDDSKVIDMLVSEKIFTYILLCDIQKIGTDYDIVICTSFPYDNIFYNMLNKPILLINRDNNIPSYISKLYTIDDYHYCISNSDKEEHKNILATQLLNTTDNILYLQLFDDYFRYTDYLPHKIIHHTEDILPRSLFNYWYLINPSIISRKNGYLVSYRLTNYCLVYNEKDDVYYTYYLNPYIIISKILLVKYDINFTLQSYYILDNCDGPFSNFTIGLEDVRLHHKNYFIATSTMENSSSINNMVYVNFKGNKILQRNVIVSPHCEKNWLVFQRDEKYFVVTTFNPLTIQHIDIMGNVIESQQYNFIQKFWRNAASPIYYPWNNYNGYISIIRQSCDHKLGLRRYYYRWIYYIFTDTVLTIFFSNPWKITTEYVEIINTIILSKNNNFLLYYSIDDEYSHLIEIDAHILDNCLVHQYTF